MWRSMYLMAAYEVEKAFDEAEGEERQYLAAIHNELIRAAE